MRKVVAVGALLLLAVPSAAAKTPSVQRAYVLTAVANVGTIYWRYDCVHYRAPEWSLGVRFSGQATTGVTYRAGLIVRKRDLPAGTLWFPFRNNRLQSLAFVQAIEPGTLRARVAVDWRGSGHCESYFPPRVTMQLYPRR